MSKWKLKKAAQEAIERLNNQELNERNITVSEARPPRERSFGGGGGGRSGGGNAVVVVVAAVAAAAAASPAAVTGASVTNLNTT